LYFICEGPRVSNALENTAQTEQQLTNEYQGWYTLFRLCHVIKDD